MDSFEFCSIYVCFFRILEIFCKIAMISARNTQNDMHRNQSFLRTDLKRFSLSTKGTHV